MLGFLGNCALNWIIYCMSLNYLCILITTEMKSKGRRNCNLWISKRLSVDYCILKPWIWNLFVSLKIFQKENSAQTESINTIKKWFPLCVLHLFISCWLPFLKHHWGLKIKLYIKYRKMKWETGGTGERIGRVKVFSGHCMYIINQIWEFCYKVCKRILQTS